MPRKKTTSKVASAAGRKVKAVPLNLADVAQLRAQIAAEVDRNRGIQQRLSTLSERFPQAYSRLNLLFTLGRLQEARGGEFPDKTAFVHMPDVILSVRRIGKLDPDTLTAAMAVYELGDIKPGIVWIPVDQVMWAGTTDSPYGVERVGLEPSPATVLKDEQYEKIRRYLAGLEREEQEKSGKPEKPAESEAKPAPEE
jgi:hypothetical protein